MELEEITSRQFMFIRREEFDKLLNEKEFEILKNGGIGGGPVVSINNKNIFNNICFLKSTNPISCDIYLKFVEKLNESVNERLNKYGMTFNKEILRLMHLNENNILSGMKAKEQNAHSRQQQIP
ncbi:MAG: hypothetical protein LBC92_02505 [Rickettsiales bacterium]|jgi:hypothetical protein|nr:hypothetical protein [Rickettsiales bacterium]